MTKIFNLRKKTFLSVVLSLVVIVCLIVANYLSSFILPADTNAESVSSADYTLYFLTLSKSQIKNEAITHAPDFREIGAGGFVWQEGEYFYVVSSVYANKNDAGLVQNSLKQTQNIESEIISVKFESVNIIGSFNADEKKIISRSLSASMNFYNSIYDIAISLDTGVYNEISAKLAVNSAHNALAKTYADFSTIYSNPVEEPIKNIDEMLEKINKTSQKLCTGEKISDAQTYSSLLKYRYIEVLSIYNEFIKSL